MPGSPGVLTHVCVGDRQRVVVERDHCGLGWRRVACTRDGGGLGHHHVELASEVALADVATCIDHAGLEARQVGGMIATITAVGVEGRAQVLDRRNTVVEVRVVDRRDEPRRHGLNDEAIQLGVVVRPLLERLIRSLDRRLVENDGGKIHPG